MSYLYLVWQLVCFKKGPQDLPWSMPLLLLSLLGTTLLQTPAMLDQLESLRNLPNAASLPTLSVTQVFLITLAQQLVYGGLLYATLRAAKKVERWLKSLQALYASQILLLALSSLLLQLSLPGGLMLMLMLVFNIWSLVVAGHIFRHSMEISQARGMWIHIGLTFATVVLLSVGLMLIFSLFGLTQGNAA